MCARRKKYRWDAKSIKALREFMGLSQTALANELGMRQQTISEWETGMYMPRHSTSKYLSIIADRVGFEFTADDTEVESERDETESLESKQQQEASD
jgi:DNA-binding transcriptional regulator YiaG